ncbi:hypothetical protein HDA32_000531 [Spinactinospora alkalitolerans]|uniref:SchA/CurD-like domain-containing protein n=1 Tax=Spinactinospora alkalitolerans TaxID=687207 RepID=A0A852TPK9_9ACTN|nr:SchA/CurD-like domain-containing protein [Spinactinospora alkalitolerans]NYE45411.1 hypothetical protein [Spinactinospora alkalitolerans]
MSFTAVLDRILPGSRDDVRGVLARTAASDGAAAPPARMPRPTGRAAFLKGDVLFRAFQFAADPGDPAAALAEDPDAVALDRGLAPFLVGAPAAGVFRGRTARRVQQRIARPEHASLAALHYPVEPGNESAIAEVFTAVRPQRRPTLSDREGRRSGLLHGVAVFVSGSDMVRVVGYDGDLDDVARYMADRPGRPEIERRLAPYLRGTHGSSSPEEFLRAFPTIRMDRIDTGAAAR